MGQSKTGSLIEATANVITGFALSWAGWTWVVGPTLGVPPNPGQAFLITTFFTLLSMARQYVWRRAFNLAGRRTRRYKSGMRWCFWRWVDIIIDGELYLRRLHIFQCPLGAIMLHWILRPDAQRDMHDHPVAFWSFPVRGWYVEETPVGRQVITWLNRKKAPDIHRIVMVSKNLVTLVFASERRRDWGFHTTEGWVPWREYEHPAHKD